MPVVAPTSFATVLADALDYVERLRATRQDGFFVSEPMLAERVAEAFGLVLPPERAATLFTQVAMRFCPHDLALPHWTLDEAHASMTAFEPRGMIMIQTQPMLVARFSDVVDMVFYRLKLPDQHTLR